MIQSLKNNTLAWLILLVGCKTAPEPMSLPFINQPDFTPEWIKASDSNYSSIHQIPKFSFTNQDNQPVTEKTVEGKIYVANFIFTRIQIRERALSVPTPNRIWICCQSLKKNLFFDEATPK